MGEPAKVLMLGFWALISKGKQKTGVLSCRKRSTEMKPGEVDPNSERKGAPRPRYEWKLLIVEVTITFWD